MRNVWRVVATTVLVLAATLPGRAQLATPPEFVPNQIVVKFRPNATEAGRARARNVVRASLRQVLHAQRRLELLRTTRPVAEAIEALRGLPEVEFAEPNWIVHHLAIPDDPRYLDGSLWGLYGNTTTPASVFGSQAAELWLKGHTGSSSVYIGIIDEGVDISHPDLAANIWTNPFDPIDGADNDGNGKIDDVHGWDFLNNDNSVYDGSPTDRDTDAHGTHVAGTIGATGGNATGVVGMNWNVSMISGKFLGAEGGTTANAAAAVEYFTDLKVRHGLNIVATNHSWGGGGYSRALHQAIIRAAKNDILFVAAAGNSNANNDVTAHYPSNYSTLVTAGSESAAAYEAVIAVASITSTGDKSSFSSYGAMTVDIAAPGSGIYSTLPQNDYGSFSGTSMAAPHVTGAVALLKSVHTSASAAIIRSLILGRGIATPSMAGITSTGRRLNAGELDEPLPTLSIDNVSVVEGSNGSQNATFTVSLSAAVSADVSVAFTTDDATTWSAERSNPAPIPIPDIGASPLYPSSVIVPAGLSPITNGSVVLKRLSHTFPRDLDVLLVGPAGQSVVLMSDAASGTDANEVTLTFDDSGLPLPTSGALLSSTYQPANYSDSQPSGPDTFPAPAPPAPYGALLSVFDGTDPAGTWRLFVTDDFGGDSGTIVQGWTLRISTANGSTVDFVAASGSLTIPAGSTTQTFAVAVNGDATSEPTETFHVNLADALGAQIVDAQGVGTIVSDDQTAFTDATFAPGVTFIRLLHITELRTRIDAVRIAKGLTAFAWTDPGLSSGSTPVKAVHIDELRTALIQAYVAGGLIPPTFTDPTLQGVAIRALHFTELQAAVVAIE